MLRAGHYQIDFTAGQFHQLIVHTGQVEKRHRSVRRKGNQDVDIAFRGVVSAGNGAE